MSLVRSGTLLFGVGLTVALCWAVAFGPTLGCTELACPDHVPTYSLAGGSLLPPALSVSDGCNVCAVAPPVTWGAVAAVAGLVVGAVGRVRRSTA